MFPPYARGAHDVPSPSMAPVHACHAHVTIRGKTYRTALGEPDPVSFLERWELDAEARDAILRGNATRSVGLAPRA